MIPGKTILIGQRLRARSCIRRPRAASALVDKHCRSTSPCQIRRTAGLQSAFWPALDWHSLSLRHVQAGSIRVYSCATVAADAASGCVAQSFWRPNRSSTIDLLHPKWWHILPATRLPHRNHLPTKRPSSSRMPTCNSRRLLLLSAAALVSACAPVLVSRTIRQGDAAI